MARKDYTAQWDYYSSLGTFSEGDVIRLSEAEADMFNRDSPGVLVPSHGESKGKLASESPDLVEGRAMEGPPQDRMFREEDVEAREVKEVDATDAAVQLAEEHGIDLTEVEGTGSGGRVILADIQKLVE